MMLVVLRLSGFLCVSLLRRCLQKAGNNGSVNKVICVRGWGCVSSSTVGLPSTYSEGDSSGVLKASEPSLPSSPPVLIECRRPT